MDVRAMRHVLAIHRHGSFIRAAEEVGVAQPTLSKSIARLEDQLGVKLFERSVAGAQVTPMGALIVERAQKIVADAERLARDIELVAIGKTGKARIGIGPGLRATLLPRLADVLASRHPALKLEINVHGREQLMAQMQGGALDVAMIAWAPDLDATDLVKIRIMNERLVAVVSSSHPLARLEKVSLAEFLRYPGANDRVVLLPFARLAEYADTLRNREPTIVCNDDDTLKHLALRGLVTVFTIQQLVQPEIDAGRLVLLPLDVKPEVTGVAVMTRAASHSPILNEIVELARNLCADIRPAGVLMGEPPALPLTSPVKPSGPAP